MGGVTSPAVRRFPFKIALAFQLALQPLLSKWLISRRMAEIGHSSPRNFLPRSEFKLVGASEENKKLKHLPLRRIATTNRQVDERRKGFHNEVSEIHCTACVTDVAACVFAG